MDPWVLVLPPLAIALLLGHVLGHGANRLGVPQVTVYLLMGSIIGPHGLPTDYFIRDILRIIALSL